MSGEAGLVSAEAPEIRPSIRLVPREDSKEEPDKFSKRIFRGKSGGVETSPEATKPKSIPKRRRMTSVTSTLYPGKPGQPPPAPAHETRKKVIEGVANKQDRVHGGAAANDAESKARRHFPGKREADSVTALLHDKASTRAPCRDANQPTRDKGIAGKTSVDINRPIRTATSSAHAKALGGSAMSSCLSWDN